MLHNVRCEVLNLTYEHLRHVTVKRGIRLLMTGKATLLEEHPTYFIRSAGDIFPVPIRIVLKRQVKFKNQHVVAPVNNRNLFLRDGYTCQYCGRHKSELRDNETLTRDHIVPQDRGGGNEWTNLATACNPCNNKKGNMLLERVNMRLLKQPNIPTVFELVNRLRYEKQARR